jgi:hypothetical protein
VKRPKDLIKVGEGEEGMAGEFDEVETRTVVYDEVVSYEASDALFTPVLAEVAEIVPFSHPTKHYIIGVKTGKGLDRPDSMRPSAGAARPSILEANLSTVQDMAPVENKREARRMSKAIVGDIVRRASQAKYSPEKIAEIPPDRLDTIPEAFKDQSTESFKIVDYPTIGFEALVNKERRDLLVKQIGPSYEIRLKKAGALREVGSNEYSIEYLDSKDVPTFDRTITIKERTV